MTFDTEPFDTTPLDRPNTDEIRWHFQAIHTAITTNVPAEDRPAFIAGYIAAMKEGKP